MNLCNWTLVYHSIEPMSKTLFNFRDFSYSWDSAFVFHLWHGTVIQSRCKFHKTNPLNGWYFNRFDFKMVNSCRPPVFLTISMLFDCLECWTDTPMSYDTQCMNNRNLIRCRRHKIRPILKQYKANVTKYTKYTQCNVWVGSFSSDFHQVIYSISIAKLAKTCKEVPINLAV